MKNLTDIALEAAQECRNAGIEVAIERMKQRPLVRCPVCGKWHDNFKNRPLGYGVCTKACGSIVFNAEVKPPREVKLLKQFYIAADVLKRNTPKPKPTLSPLEKAEQERVRLVAEKRAERLRVDYRARAVHEGEQFDRRDVFIRDNWTCHICGLPVERDKKYPYPTAPVLDHIKPLVKGGEHSMDNTACAHSRCNTVKLDRELPVAKIEELQRYMSAMLNTRCTA